jgi:hypothetical protein
MKQYLKSYISHLIEAAVGGDQAIEAGLALYRGAGTRSPRRTIWRSGNTATTLR